jgi:hypothetical protein
MMNTKTKTQPGRGAGVDETLISRFATGERRSMSIQTAEKLAEYFKLRLRK